MKNGNHIVDPVVDLENHVFGGCGKSHGGCKTSCENAIAPIFDIHQVPRKEPCDPPAHRCQREELQKTQIEEDAKAVRAENQSLREQLANEQRALEALDSDGMGRVVVGMGWMTVMVHKGMS